MKYRRFLASMAAAAALAVSCQNGTSEQSKSIDTLRSEFANPPQDARPQVWWHWMDGNITKDGIRKDIEWMKASGIGGFHNFDAGLNTPQIVENRLIYMHDDWKDAFHYAVSMADSLGLDVTIASSPGWSCMGGPWVKPEDAMKKIVWREVRVQGGQKVEMTLPDGYNVSGNFQNAANGEISQAFYKDIAVMAVKSGDEDKTIEEMGAKITTSGGNADIASLTDGDLQTASKIMENKKGLPWILYEFPEAQTFRSVTVADGRTRGQWANEPADMSTMLESSDDGVNFTKVTDVPASNAGILTVSFPAVKAKYFRLAFANPIASLDGLGEYATMAALMGYKLPSVEGPLSKDIYEFNLSPVEKVNHAEEKAGYAAPHDLAMYPSLTDAGDVANEVIDVTSFVNDGVLSWDAPEGNWKIFRIGYSLTGKQNSPAPKEATGLEVDKMDPQAWSTYFHTYFDMYKEASQGLMGDKGIRNVLTDSYEAGQENWTPAMAEEFKARRGYDLLPWLPALTGEIIGSAEKTEAFLFDYRKTMSELVAERYDDLTDIAHEYGLRGRWSEAHENGRVYVVDGMDVKRSSMIPMSAIWMPHPMNTGSKVPMAKADIRESASVAHIFGQNYVAAESLTSTGFGHQAYSFCPENLKPVVDIEFANGLNRLVVHESAHQPDDEHVPGVGLMIFGQWFNRHETWAPLAKYWMDYVARSSYMLQQGRFSADILYYYGEDSNITAQYGFSLPDVPKGYAYDFANPTVLKEMLSVGKDQTLNTTSGMKYKVLVLDRNCETMSVDILKKIKEFADKGVKIVGSAPLAKAGNAGTQEEFDALCKDIFAAGRANVMAEISEAVKDVPADYITDADLSIVHRDLGDKQIWWVSNPSDQPASVAVSFNVSGLKPEIWDPETGSFSDATYKMEDGRTIVSMDMVENDAKFVVFAEKTNETSFTATKLQEVSEYAVEGPWNVSFEQALGAPESTTFEALESLSKNADPDIRYFSGTTDYTSTFTCKASDGQKIMLDLGTVKNIAQIFVNGQEVAVLWKSPFKCNITDAVKDGENTLEVKVTNLWPNRIIGDLQPGAKPVTYTSVQFYSAGDDLLPSGLIGPVKILALE